MTRSRNSHRGSYQRINRSDPWDLCNRIEKTAKKHTIKRVYLEYARNGVKPWWRKKQITSLDDPTFGVGRWTVIWWVEPNESIIRTNALEDFKPNFHLNQLKIHKNMKKKVDCIGEMHFLHVLISEHHPNHIQSLCHYSMIDGIRMRCCAQDIVIIAKNGISIRNNLEKEKQQLQKHWNLTLNYFKETEENVEQFFQSLSPQKSGR